MSIDNNKLTWAQRVKKTLGKEKEIDPDPFADFPERKIKREQLYGNLNTYTEEDFRKRNIRDSAAIVKYPNGDMMYIGDFHSGVPDGEGSYYQDGKLRYDGKWENGSYSEGILYYSTGGIEYKGLFKFDKPEGEGTTYYRNGNIMYKGGFRMGKADGEGTLYFPTGRIEYKGPFSYGEYTKYGTLYHESDNSDIIKYIGDFYKGQMHGEGILYEEDGTVKHRGVFYVGDYIDKGPLYTEDGYLMPRYEGMFFPMDIIPIEVHRERLLKIYPKLAKRGQNGGTARGASVDSESSDEPPMWARR